MSVIERTIQLSFQQRVYFTRHIFGVGNPLLKTTLTATNDPPARVLIVRDDQVEELKKKGMINVRETRTVLNCPIIKVGKGGS